MIVTPEQYEALVYAQFLIGLVLFLLTIGMFAKVGLLLRMESRTKQLMSAIENLHNAVTNQSTVETEGFAALNDALAELTNDLKGLPQAVDLQAETDRLVANTEIIRSATATISQAIRDAIPTPTPPPATGDGGSTGGDTGGGDTSGNS